MDDSHSFDVPPRKRRWPWILLGLAIILVGGIAGYRAYFAGKVEAHLDAIRQAGEPVNATDLDRWYENVSVDENAALKVLEAADAVSIDSRLMAKLEWPTRSEPLTPEQKQSFDLILHANARALQILHRGVSRAQSRYPVNLSSGPGALLPHLAKVREITQLLRIEAAVASENGDAQAAVQAVRDSLQLGRSLEDEPLLITQMVRSSCLSIAIASLERVLVRHALSEAQLLALASVFQGAEARNQAAFVRGLIGERCSGTHIFQLSGSEVARVLGPDAGDGFPVFHHVLDLVGVRKQDFFFYLKTMDRWIRSCELSFPDCLEQARAVNRELTSSIQRRKLFVLSSQLLPYFGGAANQMAGTAARLRCVQVAVAVERFRLKNNGEPPAGLERLSPAFLSRLPTDPFDGNPLRYRLLPKGYVIYSLGEDGADQGGAGPSQKKSDRSQPHDVVFTVER